MSIKIQVPIYLSKTKEVSVLTKFGIVELSNSFS